MVAELPELLLPGAVAWRAWLTNHHDASAGVWLVLGKKGGDVTALGYAGALDEALCFGWIDGQVRRRDAGSFFQRFGPRAKRSVWSVRNTEYVTRLEAEGKMQAAGRAAVELAKVDGRWEAAYAKQSDAELPADLLAAIEAEPEAARMLAVLTAQNRYALYFRLSNIKTPAARERKIAGFVRMLAEHKTPHPQKARPQ